MQVCVLDLRIAPLCCSVGVPCSGQDKEREMVGPGQSNGRRERVVGEREDFGSLSTGKQGGSGEAREGEEIVWMKDGQDLGRVFFAAGACACLSLE